MESPLALCYSLPPVVLVSSSLLFSFRAGGGILLPVNASPVKESYSLPDGHKIRVRIGRSLRKLAITNETTLPGPFS